MLRLRSEETDGHAEPVLAAPVSRLWWAGSQLLVVAIGTVAVLVIGGLGMGLGYGLASSTLSHQLPSLLGASLAQIPAALVIAAVAVAAQSACCRAGVPGSGGRPSPSPS